MSVTSKQVIELYRELIRYSRRLRFTDKKFFTKRIQQEFRANQTLTDEKQIQFNYEARLMFRNSLSLNLFRKITINNHWTHHKFYKRKSYIDYSKVPELKECDLEEKVISGWGPGGSKVNKAKNAVFLKHIPSGLFVKVHEQRELHKNREIARELLTFKLDEVVNGENSVKEQQRRYDEEKEKKQLYLSSKKRELKRRFKESLASTKLSEDLEKTDEI